MLLALDDIMSHTALMISKDKLLNATPKPNINHCPEELQAWAVKAIRFKISLAVIAHSLPTCKV